MTALSAALCCSCEGTVPLRIVVRNESTGGPALSGHLTLILAGGETRASWQWSGLLEEADGAVVKVPVWYVGKTGGLFCKVSVTRWPARRGFPFLLMVC